MADGTESSDFEGKKIFFLFPTAVMQNSIIVELVQHEYEVYVANNKDTVRRVLRNYPGSIVFVDINEKMPETEWEMWIRAVMKAPDTKTISIGVITSNGDEEIKKKYLETIKVTAGYTVLNFDLSKGIKQIADVLQSINAKGRRKYVRATAGSDSSATVNVPVDGAFVKGQVKDISAVGISFTLEGNPEFPKNTMLKDVQMVLQMSRLKVEGILYGSRTEGDEKVYVLLFSPQRTDSEVRAKIRKYVQYALQLRMDEELR